MNFSECFGVRRDNVLTNEVSNSAQGDCASNGDVLPVTGGGIKLQRR